MFSINISFSESPVIHDDFELDVYLTSAGLIEYATHSIYEPRASRTLGKQHRLHLIRHSLVPFVYSFEILGDGGWAGAFADGNYH